MDMPVGYRRIRQRHMILEKNVLQVEAICHCHSWVLASEPQERLMKPGRARSSWQNGITHQDKTTEATNRGARSQSVFSEH